LAHHLAGKTAEEIAELTGYHPLTVYGILRKDEVINLRQEMLSGVQMEFEALYAKAVEVLKRKLESSEEAIQMQAVNTFFREKGRLEGGNQQQFNITAEDVVIQILNQAKEEPADDS
jgi:predicted transcriptional regulator